jgi:hypothetical protein
VDGSAGLHSGELVDQTDESGFNQSSPFGKGAPGQSGVASPLTLLRAGLLASSAALNLPADRGRWCA